MFYLTVDSHVQIPHKSDQMMLKNFLMSCCCVALYFPGNFQGDASYRLLNYHDASYSTS